MVITRIHLNIDNSSKTRFPLEGGAPMRKTLPRMRSQNGVSEVIGTILILAMTVVLFASIILWVSAIPTPQASIRIDMDGALAPFYDNGVWDGANFTVRHRGGETLFGAGTSVYFT